MTKIVSKAHSLEGWQLKNWFVGNWKTIKELIKVGVPYAISTFFSADLAMQGFITIVGKFILDTGEYWYKEYTR